jgi:RNA-directed DNA polymerase
MEVTPARGGNEHPGMHGAANGLMELVCERQNLVAALKRVRQNKGSPGIDGMTVKELPAFSRCTGCGCARKSSRVATGRIQ